MSSMNFRKAINAVYTKDNISPSMIEIFYEKI